MEVKGEKIVVGNVPVDATGTKVEPEQQPIQRILNVSDKVRLGSGIGDGESTVTDKEIGTFISCEMSAAEFAIPYSEPCHSCRHFDQKRASELIARAENNPKGQAILRTFIDEVGDPRRVKNAGICGPLSEVARDTVFVLPEVTCPDKVRDVEGREQPFGRHYAPRDLNEEKNSSRAYDSVLQSAQGKIP